MNPYCVVLCAKPLVNLAGHQQMKSVYLSAVTAERAIQTALDDNPDCRFVGIEPSNLFARSPQGEPSRPARNDWHTAS
jgi:hypothetical protein